MNKSPPLFDGFCTDKPRVYGGKVRNCFGFPSKFNGCDHPLELQVSFKNKNRAEIYIKTNTPFEDEYLFIVLKKADEWRIDSYKNRRYGNEKWRALGVKQYDLFQSLSLEIIEFIALK
ncbi:NTF2 fold immunity protein [Shewanella sp.]|uniref:NTF2 fold immunity protein n=1 Tax=Shewanella sp. TaxID=50422 RepID=UPI003A840F4F